MAEEPPPARPIIAEEVTVPDDIETVFISLGMEGGKQKRKKKEKKKDKEKEKEEGVNEERNEGKKEAEKEKPRVSEWCVEDVCDWLSQLRLGEETTGYLKTFRDQQIDGQVLLSFAKEDLYDEKKLNIISFGHRKKLWAAIESLR